MNQPGDPNFDQNSQTNPFTADLKGEFGSNFGTGTNAVSQIFKEGGFAGDQKTKTMIGVGALIVVALLAYVLMGSGDDDPYGAYVEDEEIGDGFDDEDDGFDDDSEDLNASKGDDKKEENEDDESELTENSNIENTDEFGDNLDNTNFANEGYNAESTDLGAPRASSRPSVSSLGTSAPVLMGPEDGLMKAYDDAGSHPEFTWSGGGGKIEFSKTPDMSVIDVEERAMDGMYRSRHLAPGIWYWRVENRFGVSDIRSFKILPAMTRNTVVAQPQEGGALAGTGGVVQWTGSSKVSYYRVELSAGSWAVPQYRFATAGTQLSVEGVAAGQYQLRVGAFSEVSGRFEYTTPIQVTVQ